MKRETWYVMEDGSCGDPREIRPGADGRLAHSDGRRVAYAPYGPRTRGVDVDCVDAPAVDPAPAVVDPASAVAEETVSPAAEEPSEGVEGPAAEAGEDLTPEGGPEAAAEPADGLLTGEATAPAADDSRDLTAEPPKRGYKTREAKAD